MSANGLYFYQHSDRDSKLYRVEARRVIKEIEEQKAADSEIKAMNFDKYETIVGIKEFVAGEICDNEYLVEEIAGKLVYIYSSDMETTLPQLKPLATNRNGQTGERFRKKSLMSLGKSRLPMSPFLALNDIVSRPRRYGIISLTFFLCLSLLLILSATVSTIKSDSLAASLGWADCDIYLDSKIISECMMEGGREKLEKHLDEMEQTLAEHGIPAKCYQEMMFTLHVSFGENEVNGICIFQGTGSTMDMYEYTAGTAPQNTDEIAITRIAADQLNATIGDTVTIKTIDGDKEYIISAFFQSFNMAGSDIRLHTDAYINYVQAGSGGNTQIAFTDHSDSKFDNREIERRIEEIQNFIRG